MAPLRARVASRAGLLRGSTERSRSTSPAVLPARVGDFAESSLLPSFWGDSPGSPAFEEQSTMDGPRTKALARAGERLAVASGDEIASAFAEAKDAFEALRHSTEILDGLHRFIEVHREGRAPRSRKGSRAISCSSTTAARSRPCARTSGPW